MVDVIERLYETYTNHGIKECQITDILEKHHGQANQIIEALRQSNIGKINAGGKEDFIYLTDESIEKIISIHKNMRNYNIYLSHHSGKNNFFNVPTEIVEKLSKNYAYGKEQVSINHQTYYFQNVSKFSVFTNELGMNASYFQEIAEREGYKGFINRHKTLSPEQLSEEGEDVTSTFIDDEPFGYKSESKIDEVISSADFYINHNRIKELENIKSKEFDLTKLIKICQELNDNWIDENYFTVGLLLRTIINHVPPIFGKYSKMSEVISNMQGKSLKNHFERLNNSLRTTADFYTHDVIRHKENLPTPQQVDFKSETDFLLDAIIKELTNLAVAGV